MGVGLINISPDRGGVGHTPCVLIIVNDNGGLQGDGAAVTECCGLQHILHGSHRCLLAG